MIDWAARRPEPRRLAGRKLTLERAALKRDISSVRGPLPNKLVARLLESYGIPVVKSAMVRSAAEAEAAASGIGYPMVVKVMSKDVPHRSDVGAVQLETRFDEEIGHRLEGVDLAVAVDDQRQSGRLDSPK